MKLSISTMTANRRFVKALRRQQGAIDELKRRFESIVVDDCPHEVLLLAFVDGDVGSCNIVPGKQDVFEVEVGYDFHGEYAADDDVLLIQLLEEKLTQMIEACDGLREARNMLLGVVENWTTETIAR